MDALIRDERGRLLVVDPVYKPGWDLPGGMVDDEGLVDGLVRELREELRPARLRVGRLLAVDNVPAAVYGRAMTACVYAVHLPHPVRVADLHLQRDELRAAEFLPEAEALERLPERLRRRTVAALAAERGAHTAHLLDGYPAPLGDRDRWALLPGPVVAAAVLVVDRAGRVLVMEGGDRRGGQTSRHRLPGTLVAADETPREAAARTLRAGPGLTGPGPTTSGSAHPGPATPSPAPPGPARPGSTHPGSGSGPGPADPRAAGAGPAGTGVAGGRLADAGAVGIRPASGRSAGTGPGGAGRAGDAAAARAADRAGPGRGAVGRLLAVDSTPCLRGGRTLLVHLFAAPCPAEQQLPPGARWLAPAEALKLLPAPEARLVRGVLSPGGESTLPETGSR
ncbi:NUDIX hydrolase [Streptomyces albus subsp. chlorinus]|uniref:NUDIX hydrolase n=1 Tax=Streptomyces albus TaxID=1888 RepID=UPI0031F66ED2